MPVTLVGSLYYWKMSLSIGAACQNMPLALLLYITRYYYEAPLLGSLNQSLGEWSSVTYY